MKEILLLTCLISLAFALDNGLGLVPPMGFNTWNHFDCRINETLIKETADAMINLGLRESGYIYLNLDDCWMGKTRVNGKLIPDPQRFPNGIKPLADYCHSRGLKLGIYSSAGNMTCERLPASLGYEDVDAATWASWDVDYLKYDNCGHDNKSSLVRYSTMRDALNKTGRPIFYSICNWGDERVWEWGSKVGNSWRTTGDIKDDFRYVRNIYRRNVPLAPFAGPGGWNDPDMLEVGNNHMSVMEYRTHFALWAIAKSPLLIGCDLRKVKKEHLEILKNKNIIALNQDPLGKQAVCKLHCSPSEYEGNTIYPQYTVMELSNEEYAVAVTNWNDARRMASVFVKYQELGLKSQSYRVKELWMNRDIGVYKDNFTIPIIIAHDTAIYRLTKA